jgi:heterodisulfide reductase subunit A
MSEEYGQSPRIGVYVCECGGNISDVVDVERVVGMAESLPDVVVARHDTFMCSDPGQKLIIDGIAALGLDRVVVASCSPSLHELTFRATLGRAGLNPFLYEHANIREQVSWCSGHDRVRATDKACRLTAAAVAKARGLVPLEAVKVPAEPTVVIVGGGMAGIQAALKLAASGFGVHLVEKSGTLGGHVADWDTLYPTDERARDLLAHQLEQLTAHPSIQVHLFSEVDAVGGYVGNFQITLRTDGPAAEAQAPTVDVRAGAILMATGFELYEPLHGELGWGVSERVITLAELVGRLRSDAPTGGRLLPGGGDVRRVAFVHCVGSRQREGVHTPGADGTLNEHCSRVCCTTALRTATEIRRRFPEVDVFDLYQDIRTYGLGQEDIYEAANEHGVTFFRYDGAKPPHVAVTDGDGWPLHITVRDLLTFGEELELPVDLVVLATGILPRDIQSLIEKLKLPRSPDGFLQEVHPKLRPVEVKVDGVFIAGTCQAPMDITEATSSGAAAAVKAAALLGDREIALDPFVAVIDPEQCDGCGRCVEECAWVHAITASDGGVVPTVNSAICKGCGMCVAVCASGAIQVRGSQLDQFEAMVDAIAVGPA